MRRRAARPWSAPAIRLPSSSLRAVERKGAASQSMAIVHRRRRRCSAHRAACPRCRASRIVTPASSLSRQPSVRSPGRVRVAAARPPRRARALARSSSQRTPRPRRALDPRRAAVSGSRSARWRSMKPVSSSAVDEGRMRRRRRAGTRVLVASPTISVSASARRRRCSARRRGPRPRRSAWRSSGRSRSRSRRPRARRCRCARRRRSRAGADARASGRRQEAACAGSSA